MLQNFDTISLALFASQLLVIVHIMGASSLVGEEYIHTEGVGAYKFHNDAQTWNEARKTCIAEGGHLAIIDAEGEKEVLLDMYNKESKDIVGTNRTDVIWLGAQDHFQKNEFVTVLGEALSTDYIKFNDKSCGPWGNQPDDGKNNKEYGPQNCLALVPNCTALDDNWCSQKFAFFCEKPNGC